MRAQRADWQLGWYLVGLRCALGRALDARRQWIPELHAMLEHARRGDTSALVGAAGRIGSTYGPTFRSCRDNLDALTPPFGWTTCHDTARAWFEQLGAACAALDALADAGDPADLRLANECLMTAGDLAARFNDEYALLSVPTRSVGRPAGTSEGVC